jgi:hypothetical protein
LGEGRRREDRESEDHDDEEEDPSHAPGCCLARRGCMLLDVLPRQGVNGRALVEWLTTLVREAHTRTADVNAYVAWVHALERNLREFFSDVPLERLYGERFWRIAAGGGERPEEMRGQEMDSQLAWLSALLDSARTMQARFGATTALIAVLDTNVLLHCKPPSDIDWRALLGAEDVRLVVPLRVIDELDAKKAARSPALRNRAATRLKSVARVLLDDATHEVRLGVAIDVVGLYEFDPDLWRRPITPPDVEILDTCEALAAYAGGNPVKLITADLGMRLRAQSRGVSWEEIPDKYRQPLGDAEQSSEEPDD